MHSNENGQGEIAIAIGVCLVGLVLLVGIPFTWVATKEWRKNISGQAALAEARSASKVKTERARADYESSKLNAKAEIERAKGTAEAVKIENGAITPSYVNYLYVKNLGKGKGNRVIYVPTETGLPILEAGKR